MSAFFSDLLGSVVQLGQVATHPKTGKRIQATQIDGQLVWKNLNGEEIPLTARPNDGRRFVSANIVGKNARAEVSR